ncbi:ATPase, putative [Trypanosoma brucei gambiense DAL972]|uniref:ATPase, putative n=1 Tax=Trypanosoma brucei gambiense (strain MHOM/CI/86/DAL972) TaxID=679716 RepID=D0A5N6_TRYB9|nr:ATPase, putative [Trypanosoma brucei gambiense DAL972]CBH16987.1 ATPase, putative [Trypanosoma brucei gambiense DAL972]|eukprot:XP_011779251.1 ATPase, putative [Trypanosoma brucei gambiense DAL972]
MIRVPSRWPCSSSPVALVQVNDDFVAICGVVSSDEELASWELDCSITLNRQVAERVTAQDFSPAGTHEVYFIGPSKQTKRRFVEVPVHPGGGGDTLRVLTPLSTYEAKTVLLEGPRVSTPGFMERLFASLVGRYVVVDCDVMTQEGLQFRVKDAELKRGYRGLALVGSTARVKLNQRSAKYFWPSDVLVGLDEQAQELRTVMQAMLQSPGRWLGVSLHDSSGCEALTVVRKCVADTNGTLVWWSPSSVYGQGGDYCASRLIVLCIPDMDEVFPSSDSSLAGLTVRLLRGSIDSLLNSGSSEKPALVLVGITKNEIIGVANSLFAAKISFEFPDVDKRAVLLAHVRGGDRMDHMSEAHTLVGLSRSEVLDAARRQPRSRGPLNKVLRWSDIGGLDDVKDRLHRALILPQLEPGLFARFGLTPPRGILLYGPPGCAKTSLVKALCSEGCFSFIYLDFAGLISAYVGESERILRDAFHRAARQAPCIVFFDEVDAIGGRRAMNSRDSDQARLLSTLLTEMDGFSSSNGVCFVGATNTPHQIDAALLRPGRFDYLVYVPLPPLEDRRRVLSLVLGSTTADLDKLARVTEGFSGADLSALATSVLLELLDGTDEGSASECLNDPEALTQLLVSRAGEFHKTSYDVAALERFNRDCSSDSGAV